MKQVNACGCACVRACVHVCVWGGVGVGDAELFYDKKMVHTVATMLSMVKHCAV
jgi:hypothetical protein